MGDVDSRGEPPNRDLVPKLPLTTYRSRVAGLQQRLARS